jgi:hypothetical protein
VTVLIGYGLIALIVAGLLFYAVIALLPDGLSFNSQSDHPPWVGAGGPPNQKKPPRPRGSPG